MESVRQWYAVHTYSGFENKVKQSIERKVAMEGLKDRVTRVIIPLEPVIEIKSGKKHTTMRNMMPGYILVEIEPSDEIFNMIEEIKGVSGFVGDGHKPASLSQSEVDNILNLLESKADKPKPEITYRQGDQVKVIEGPFANFNGTVDHVDEEKNKLSVMVSIFGRPTPVELDILQVEPV
ncbi:MAG: transcription termination/antitermination protein NusG [bacterium]|nr:transcription termination/antitermination protein NusG [bacterium]